MVALADNDPSRPPCPGFASTSPPLSFPFSLSRSVPVRPRTGPPVAAKDLWVCVLFAGMAVPVASVAPFLGIPASPGRLDCGSGWDRRRRGGAPVLTYPDSGPGGVECPSPRDAHAPAFCSSLALAFCRNPGSSERRGSAGQDSPACGWTGETPCGILGSR